MSYDEVLEAYVMVAIRHHLMDFAKSTDVGKLRRRFVNVLSDDERFVRSTGAEQTWVLAKFDGQIWSGELTLLRSAAARVRGVFIEKLNPAGPTPRDVADALRAVAAAVLVEARGAVPAQDLARVVFERFFPGDEAVEYLDEPGAEDVADLRPGPDSEVLIDAAARAVFMGLGVKEKALLPHLGETPEERVGVLENTGPNETAAIAEALRVKIAQAVEDDGEADEVVLALLDLCWDEP